MYLCILSVITGVFIQMSVLLQSLVIVSAKFEVPLKSELLTVWSQYFKFAFLPKLVNKYLCSDFVVFDFLSCFT